MASIVTRLWKQQPGDYFVLCTKRDGDWKERFIHRDNLSDVDDLIQKYMNAECDLYFCPHGFSAKKRTKANSVKPTLLWADLDEVDPRDLMDVLHPSIAWESSPHRFQAIWKIDAEMTEDMNKRLTYKIGADKSGWDLTQVLRVPGSWNYKYSAPVQGRLLWGNGPTHELKFVKRIVGDEKHHPKDVIRADLDPKAIYRKYEKALTPAARRDIKSQKATAGKRSEVLWRLWHDCFDAGMDSDEAIALLKSTVWNKFAGRLREDEQLVAEAFKALEERGNNGNKRPADSIPNKKAVVDGKIRRIDLEENMIRMDEVQPINVDWLVPGIIPRGALTIVEGDPGVGKSYMMQYISMLVCDGKKFLTRRQYHQRPKAGTVLYFDIENDPESVTKPRLIDNGLQNEGSFIQVKEILSLDTETDIEKLEMYIRFTKPDLVVFDTINTYMGSGDTHKASDVQQALSKVAGLARDYGFGCVLLRHLTKGGKDKVQYRGQGSIAFMGMARVVHTVAKHPREEDMIVMKTTKMNFGKAEPPLKYYLEDLPPTLGRDERSRLVIECHDETVTDEEINNPPKERTKRDDLKAKAEMLIKTFVNGAGTAYEKIVRQAEAKGITAEALDKASKDLNVRREKVRNKLMWFLDA